MNEYHEMIQKLQKDIINLKKEHFKLQERHDELKTNLGSHILELSRRCKALEAELKRRK